MHPVPDGWFEPVSPMEAVALFVLLYLFMYVGALWAGV